MKDMTGYMHKTGFLLLQRETEVGLVLQDALGKDVVKIGFPPAKKLGWVSMEKGSTGEQMLMSKVGLVSIAHANVLMKAGNLSTGM